MQASASNSARRVTRISRGDLGNLGLIDTWLSETGIDGNASLFKPLISGKGETYSSLGRRQNAAWARTIVVEGISLSQDKKLSEAISKYTKAIEIDPECVDAYVARGAAHANQGSFDKAIADHTHALKLQPSHENAQRYLQKCIQRRNEIEAEKQSAVDGAFLMPLEPQSRISSKMAKNPAPPRHALMSNQGSHSAASLDSLTSSIHTNSNDAYAFVFDDTEDTVALPPPSSKKRKKEKSESSKKKKKHKSRDKKKKKSSKHSHHQDGTDSDSDASTDKESNERDVKLNCFMPPKHKARSGAGTDTERLQSLRRPRTACTRCSHTHKNCEYENSPQLDLETPISIGNLSVEDPDMMPTMQDWVIVYNYLRSGGQSLWAMIDPVKFLQSFLSEPPFLRYAVCAVAAHQRLPKVSSRVSLAYFNRAKQAVKRRSDVSIKMIQALFCLSSFATSNGQPDLSKPYFVKSIPMLFQLRLHVDPDDSPWLAHLNLSEEDKNERRMTFWTLFQCVQVVQMTTINRGEFYAMPGHSVKFAKQVALDAVIKAPVTLPEVATVCYLNLITNVMVDTAILHSKTPASAMELLVGSAAVLLDRRLAIAKEHIPDRLLVSEPSILFQMAESNPFTPVIHIAITTIMYNSALCILHRPRLYLTAYLSLTSPLLLDPDNLMILLTLLEVCLSAAEKIATINSWILHRSKSGKDNDGGMFSKKLWQKHSLLSFGLFEAAVVSWFVTCKTNPFWWRNQEGDVSMTDEYAAASSSLHVLRMTHSDRQRLRSSVMDILRTYEDLEGSLSSEENAAQSNIATPFITCISAMLREMEQVELNIQAGLPFNSEAKVKRDDVEDLVLGVTVMSFGEEESVEPYKGTPWAFLGLLGADVMGYIKWAAYEEGWREFWRTLSV
ncbi:Tetratricopeptide repeat protein 14 [Chytriomyces hyalinus]|nr:Tetratricopeptide repeat protein 14 [Chytriomyces hyalinus]